MNGVEAYPPSCHATGVRHTVAYIPVRLIFSVHYNDPMERRFERRRFVPVAELNTEGVLPRGLATDLRLARTWNEVAGAALASRARLVALRRGVLELEVEDSDWALAIRPLRRLRSPTAANCRAFREALRRAAGPP
jgi:hypothetical protein